MERTAKSATRIDHFVATIEHLGTMSGDSEIASDESEGTIGELEEAIDDSDEAIGELDMATDDSEEAIGELDMAIDEWEMAIDHWDKPICHVAMAGDDGIKAMGEFCREIGRRKETRDRDGAIGAFGKLSLFQNGEPT